VSTIDEGDQMGDRAVGTNGAQRWIRCAAVASALAVLSLAGCANDPVDVSQAGPDTSETAVPETTVPETTAAETAVPEDAAATCEVPEIATVSAAAVAGSESDLDVDSFDGTKIRAHWFPAPGASMDTPAPTVLMGPGWGLAGDSNPDAIGPLGGVSIATFNAGGYNVLTWDPRGFGKSGGTATVNDKDFEGRDVQQLIEWVAAQPEAQLDAAHDPTMGMVGGSYGGGIQLVVAAIDCRVDAIVPIVAWHSLETSLFKAETIKSGWSGTLAGVTATAQVDPHVDHAQATGAATGLLDDEDRAWFVSRGPGDLVDQITVPTLLIGGTVDTLFTLDENLTNYDILQGNDVAVSMLWFCGGHGVCLTDEGDPARVSVAAVAWLDRYVKRDESVDTGPRFDIIDQDGVRHTADEYPAAATGQITAKGSGTLDLVAEGGAGPVVVQLGAGGVVGGLAGGLTPAKATNAVDVQLRVDDEAMVVGAPTLKLSYRGTVPAGTRPTRVFAQLIDDTTGFVIGNQITPIEVTLDGAGHTAEIPLEVIAFAAHAGSTVTLQLAATTVAYAPPRLGGSINFDSIELSLPVVSGLTTG